jgi:hypothetical protein
LIEFGLYLLVEFDREWGLDQRHGTVPQRDQQQARAA